MTKRDIDEQVVRDRRDPRREESVPPERRPPSVAPEVVLDVSALAPSVQPGPALEPKAHTEPPPPSSKRAVPVAVESLPQIPVEDAREATGRVVTNKDPRVEEVEGLLRLNDWDGVLRVLGPGDQAGRLPPNLGLIYAIARKEKETTDSKGSDATEIAIRCTAGLLGVTVDSPLALVVGKRIVRKNPVAWQKAPAPPASVSAIIILIAVVLGGGIGWLVATGRLHVRW